MSVQQEPTPEQKLNILGHKLNHVATELFLLRAVVRAIAKHLTIDVDEVESDAIAAKVQANATEQMQSRIMDPGLAIDITKLGVRN